MDPVELVVRKVGQNEELEVLQHPDVQPRDGRPGHVEVPERRQVSQRPLRDVLDVAAVDLEQLQLPESHDPRHRHDLRVFDAEDGQLPQEVDGVGRQALQLRLLDVDLALECGQGDNNVKLVRSLM